jgi:gluconokinase
MQASQEYLIGIDIGTGSVKAVALNNTGAVIHTFQTHYPSSTGNASEQDVNRVFEAFKNCLNEIIKAQGSSPQAVCLSAAMHSVLAVDEYGKPLMDAMLWSDTQSSDIAERLRHSEEGKALYKATGTPLHAMSPLCKIRWLKECKPDLFSNAHKFISVKEFIWHQLFGEYVIDYSIASATGLFNIHSLQWHEEALAFAGIGSERLSAPVATTYKKAGIDSSVAGEVGIHADTVFFIGASDGCLANLGSGCVDASTAAITIGTSAAVRITSPTPIVDEEKMIFNYLLDEHTFVCGGATNNGGNVLEWTVEKFASQNKDEKEFDDAFREIETVPAGSSALIFLPYLHGERAPVWDEKSCGVFFGVRAFHDQASFMRAAVEGICFSLFDVLSSLESASLPVEEIKLSGGAAKAKVFVQILADVTGKKIRTQDAGDASAIGAAYLALKQVKAAKNYSFLPQAASEITQPVKGNANVYKKLVAVYKELYPSLKEVMHTLHQSFPS